MRKKAKKAAVKKPATKSTPTAFKEWCHVKHITQAQIHNTTHYSMRSVHHFWNGGSKINKSTIHHLALTYRVKEDIMAQMLQPGSRFNKIFPNGI